MRSLALAAVALTLAAHGHGQTRKPTTGKAVLAAFKRAGLQAEKPSEMEPREFGMAPLVSTTAYRFLIPSLGKGNGGRVFTFATNKDRDAMRAYYVGLGRRSAIFYSWTFVADRVLVQINGELPKARAEKYRKVVAVLPQAG